MLLGAPELEEELLELLLEELELLDELELLLDELELLLLELLLELLEDEPVSSVDSPPQPTKNAHSVKGKSDTPDDNCLYLIVFSTPILLLIYKMLTNTTRMSTQSEVATTWPQK